LGVIVPAASSPVAPDLEAALYDWHNARTLRQQNADGAFWARTFGGAQSVAILGAGTGRVVAALRRRGLECRLVAVDRSAARLARIERDLDVECVVADFRERPEITPVDAVLLPYSAFQMVENGLGRARTLGAATSLLVAGGVCGIDVSTSFDERSSHGWELVLHGWSDELAARVEEWQHVSQTPDAAVVRHRYRVGTFEAGEVVERWAHHRQLRLPALLAKAGLEIVSVEAGYGNGVASHRRAYVARR
jgi:SAM-dependent methyltransferase